MTIRFFDDDLDYEIMSNTKSSLVNKRVTTIETSPIKLPINKTVAKQETTSIECEEDIKYGIQVSEDELNQFIQNENHENEDDKVNETLQVTNHILDDQSINNVSISLVNPNPNHVSSFL